jgi:hypothetical protein
VIPNTEAAMSELAKKSCVPCTGDEPRLTREEYAPLLAQIGDWEVIGDHHLERTIRFPDFQSGLDRLDARHRRPGRGRLRPRRQDRYARGALNSLFRGSRLS